MKVNKKRKLEDSQAVTEWKWTEHDAALLIRLVRQCQKLGSSGAHGEWKAFLKVSAFPYKLDIASSHPHQRFKLHVSCCLQAQYPKLRSQDPALHHWRVRLHASVGVRHAPAAAPHLFRGLQVLAAFVNTLSDEADTKLVARHIEWERLVRAEREALAAADSGAPGSSLGSPAEPSEQQEASAFVSPSCHCMHVANACKSAASQASCLACIAGLGTGAADGAACAL